MADLFKLVAAARRGRIELNDCVPLWEELMRAGASFHSFGDGPTVHESLILRVGEVEVTCYRDRSLTMEERHMRLEEARARLFPPEEPPTDLYSSDGPEPDLDFVVTTVVP